MSDKNQIRLGIAGVGNCASALIQGVSYYSDGRTDGLMHASLGGYQVSDIVPVCGFDVDERKVGNSISEAIRADPNCTDEFDESVTFDGPVYKGPVLDGVADHTQNREAAERVLVDRQTESVDVADKLREHEVDVLVSYLPVGSTEATHHFADQCLEAGVAFVNAVPVFIASDEKWAKKFDEAELPIVGDDIKSQIGATITHRSLVQLFEDRGVSLQDTYQLNIGGNTDFLNMLDQARLSSKKTSKTEAVNELLESPLDDSHIHIGPSDYVPWLDDQKTAFIRMEGAKFGGASVTVDLKLDVEDSPNSAGSVVDAVRCAKIALDEGITGPLEGPSAFTMKHPPVQLPDTEAKDRIKKFAGSGE